jgi:hypothetical protein
MKLLSQCFVVISRLPSSTRIIQMTYSDFYRLFVRTAASLKVHAIPSLGRHSGASIDRAENHRSLEEVQRIGRWASRKSMLRYEKRGRLNVTWNALTASQQENFQTCQDRIQDTILHGKLPLVFDRPSGCSGKASSALLPVSSTQLKRAAGANTERVLSGVAGTSSLTVGTGRNKRRNTAMG